MFGLRTVLPHRPHPRRRKEGEELKNPARILARSKEASESHQVWTVQDHKTLKRHLANLEEQAKTLTDVANLTVRAEETLKAAEKEVPMALTEAATLARKVLGA